MDAVIMFVDMNDPKWVEEHNKYTIRDVRDIRFRDWGFLKYVMRGIETYMPFIDKIHLVVMMDSQVPEWVNREKVHIVYHEDFIPKDVLPLFNSSSLEMFIHKIPGLSEQFIYLNDDFFPSQLMSEDDFFTEDGKIYGHMTDDGLHDGYYMLCTIKSTRLAALVANKEVDDYYYLTPQHTLAPMIKSSQEFLYNSLENIILSSCSKFRQPNNMHQYLFTNYLYFTDRFVDKELSFDMFLTIYSNMSDIEAAFFNEDIKTICINDWGDFVGIPFEDAKVQMTTILEKKYPNKSIYEN